MTRVSQTKTPEQVITVTLTPAEHTALLSLLDKERREVSLNTPEFSAFKKLQGAQK